MLVKPCAHSNKEKFSLNWKFDKSSLLMFSPLPIHYYFEVILKICICHESSVFLWNVQNYVMIKSVTGEI